MMTFTTKKFIYYLEEQRILLLDKIKKLIIEKAPESSIYPLKVEVFQITDTINFLNDSDESYKSIQGKIFTSFEFLSKKLENSPLNIREYPEIIFTIIIKNIYNFKIFDCNTKYIIDTNRANHYLNRVSDKNIDKYLQGTYSNELVRKINNLTNKENIDLQFLLKLKEKCSLKDINIINTYLMIEEHFINKLNYYNTDDINKTIESLTTLNISPKVCTIIKNTLRKEYSNRQKENNTSLLLSLDLKIKQKKLLTNKEYKTIKKELNTYYDFTHNKVIKTLTYEDIIYCLSNLIIIGENKQIIINFLKNTLNINHNNSLQERLNRLKFYQEQYGIQEQIKNLEENIKEIETATTNEEYLLWKNILLEELIKLESIISKNYEYEFYVAKTRTKKKKEGTLNEIPSN